MTDKSSCRFSLFVNVAVNHFTRSDRIYQFVCVCVCTPALVVMQSYCIFICALSGCSIFFHIKYMIFGLGGGI